MCDASLSFPLHGKNNRCIGHNAQDSGVLLLNADGRASKA
jgi:hypothetical protein